MGSGQQLHDANAEWARRPADQRYETLAALREAVHRRRMASYSHDVESDDIIVVPVDGGIVVEDDRRMLRASPTHWSFGQLASLSGLGAGFLRKLPPANVAADLNHCLQSERATGVKLLTYDDGGGSDRLRLHAVTSPTYGRIWDADVADAVAALIERSDGKWYNPKDWSGKPSGLYASDRDMFAFMIDGGSILDAGMTWDNQPDELHRGFFVSHSEVGAGKLRVTLFKHRVVCGNHICWDVEGVERLEIRTEAAKAAEAALAEPVSEEEAADRR